MKIVKPKCEIIQQAPGLEGIYRQIEIAGRTCYKSEDKITNSSSEKFVQRLIKNKHFAMLEHGTVYLFVSYDPWEAEASEKLDLINRYATNKYSTVNSTKQEKFYITSNMRVLVENKWLNDLDYLADATENFEERLTIRFTTQIAISREFNRHRINSMAEQSTIYCNYSSDKFKGVHVNLPSFIDEKDISSKDLKEPLKVYCARYINKKDALTIVDWWLFANLASEEAYLQMLKLGAKPHQARTVLNLDTNTELVHTASIPAWHSFAYLRASHSTGFQHPDAEVLGKELAGILQFVRGYALIEDLTQKSFTFTLQELYFAIARGLDPFNKVYFEGEKLFETYIDTCEETRKPILCTWFNKEVLDKYGIKYQQFLGK